MNGCIPNQTKRTGTNRHTYTSTNRHTYTRTNRHTYRSMRCSCALKQQQGLVGKHINKHSSTGIQTHNVIQLHADTCIKTHTIRITIVLYSPPQDLSPPHQTSPQHQHRRHTFEFDSHRSISNDTVLYAGVYSLYAGVYSLYEVVYSLYAGVYSLYAGVYSLYAGKIRKHWIQHGWVDI